MWVAGGVFLIDGTSGSKGLKPEGRGHTFWSMRDLDMSQITLEGFGNEK